MGTNYYWYEQPKCDACGRGFEPRHIGKASGGWCFALHVYPEDGINGLTDWEDRWVSHPHGYILDEYNREISTEEMRRTITDRSWEDRVEAKIPLGYSSWASFYLINLAEPGPCGLARAKIDGSHCIGHGDGTWDLFLGEFS